MFELSNFKPGDQIQFVLDDGKHRYGRVWGTEQDRIVVCPQPFEGDLWLVLPDAVVGLNDQPDNWNKAHQ